MVALRKTDSEMVARGMYVVAKDSGDVHALVDPEVCALMPRIKNVVEGIAWLVRQNTNRDLALWIRIEPGPQAAVGVPVPQEIAVGAAN